MFNRVNNTTYTMSPEESSRVTAIAVTTINGLGNCETPVNPNTRITDIRNIIAMVVGRAVCERLNDILASNGFLCIKVCGDYPVLIK